MGKIVFIVGGSRSGKSSYAVHLAQKYKKVAFIATAQALDKEMKQRIRFHRKSRPGHWKTFEEALAPCPLLTRIGNKFDCLIIDCITLLVSNLILRKKNQDAIIKSIKTTLAVIKKKEATTIIVSNEVGLGIVPDNALGRKFRDIAGKINLIIAQDADEVFFTVAGLPWKIK